MVNEVKNTMGSRRAKRPWQKMRGGLGGLVLLEEPTLRAN